MSAPVADALSSVAALASAAYDLMLQSAMETILRYGSLTQAWLVYLENQISQFHARTTNTQIHTNIYIYIYILIYGYIYIYADSSTTSVYLHLYT